MKYVSAVVVFALAFGTCITVSAEEPTTPLDAQVINQKKRLEADVAWEKKSLQENEKELGPVHPKVARSLNNLGMVYFLQGEFALAEPLLIRAIKIFEGTAGPDSHEVAGSLHNLAQLYVKQGKYAQAEPLYKRSLMIKEKSPFVSGLARSMRDLAELYFATGRPDAAKDLLKQAEAIEHRKP